MRELHMYLLLEEVNNDIYNNTVICKSREDIMERFNQQLDYNESNDNPDKNYIVFSLSDIDAFKTDASRITLGKMLYDTFYNYMVLKYQDSDKIKEIISSFKCKYFLINFDGDVYSLTNYKVLEMKDMFCNVYISKLKENSDFYIDKYKKLENKPDNILDAMRAEVCKTAIYKYVITDELDKNKDEIEDFIAKEKANLLIENEFDALFGYIGKITNNAKDIEFKSIKNSENEEVDSGKFFDKLSSNTYPDYYIYKSILDDEYTIETNYGTIKKKKSKDIYNLNFEFIKKS